MKSLTCLLGLVTLASLVGGCGNAPPPDENVSIFKRAEEYPVATYQYHIDPPDEITVRAPNIKELDNQKKVVAPDGTVTFNLIGKVPVQGMTPDQLSDTLTRLTKRYYVDADIKVEVAVNSKFFYIFGPGFSVPTKYAYTGRNTIVNAIAEAGIQYDTGWPEKVILNRSDKEGNLKGRVVIDFTKVYEVGDMKQNFLLEEGDKLYMQHDPLTKVNINLTKVLGPITGASALTTQSGNVVKSGTK